MILIRPHFCALLMTCAGLTSQHDSAQTTVANEAKQQALLAEAAKAYRLSAQVFEDHCCDLDEEDNDVVSYQDFVAPSVTTHKEPPARRFVFYG